MGVASLVLGILGLVLFWIPYVGLVLAFIGLILGFLAVRSKPSDGSPPKGKGLAMAGLVLSIVGTLVGAYWVYKVRQAVSAMDAAFQKGGAFDKAMDKAAKDMEADMKKAGEDMKKDAEKAHEEATKPAE